MIQRLIGLLALAILLSVSGAYAGVIIDDFDFPPALDSANMYPYVSTRRNLTIPFTNTGLPTTDTLGGIRDGNVTCLTGCSKDSGIGNGRVVSANLNSPGQAMSLNTGIVTTGRINLRYDGNATGGALNNSGSPNLPTTNLLDVDFTTGNATEIFMKIIAADIGLRIEFVFYGHTTNNVNPAIATLLLDVPAGPSDQHLPFSIFGADHLSKRTGGSPVDSCGPNFPGCPDTPGAVLAGSPHSTVGLGGLDFHHIGAVDLILQGNAAADGTIDFIQSASAVPEPGALILLGTGIFGLGFLRRMRYRRK